MEKVEESIITFFCDRCRIDWRLLAHKHFKNKVLGVCWVARCEECGHDMCRLINDAPNDPYYRRSTKTRADVRKYADDLVQPGDPRFDILYPEHKRKREAEAEAKQRKEWEANQ